jgi:hypothetical protein
MLDTRIAPDADGEPSAYWQEELANIEYLLDASPLVVEQLRRHSYHVTGVWPYNYRSHKDKHRHLHYAKLEALMEIGDESLFVPEPDLLGGFGFPVQGGLLNLDTLKYFEVLIGLDRGGALIPFRRPDERPIVWEIGSGWGGFAYQFKTLFPKSTYVMTDLPELFLFSATYLRTAFPEASIQFWSPERALADVDWDSADFVFVPNTARLGGPDPPRLDLTVNMVSFQEMRTDQVDAYAETAWELGAPILYSLNRERSVYNPELVSVSDIVSKYFSLHQVDILPVDYGQLPAQVERYSPKSIRKSGRTEGYRHQVGWRRSEAVAGRRDVNA